MNPYLAPYRDVLEGILKIPEKDGPNKIMNLHDAISRFVRPGMQIHTLATHTFPYALIHELLRQFWKRDPRFKLISLGAVNHAVLMLHGELLTRIVTSFCGDLYPAPGPNPHFTQAYLGGKVEIENWTVLTLTLRLLAGALGLAGMPCRSLEGTTMSEENRHAYQSIASPFADGQMGWVRALRADLSLVHGWVADPAGNVVFAPPLSENLWGAVGAVQGVIAGVEKIVDTNFIRAHAHLPRLPGQFVRAVVELPFGAHPGGLYGGPVRSCLSYAEDYDFIVEFRDANRDPDRIDDWVKKWILDCPTHLDYLKRLTPSRLADLVQKGRPNYWEDELIRLMPQLPTGSSPTPYERMTVAAAHQIVEHSRRMGIQFILAGQGFSNLAAWLAVGLLKREGLEVDLITEAGFVGYTPRPTSPFIFNFGNLPSCKMLCDSLWTLGGLAGGASARCLGSLSAGQVDRVGCINSTLIPRTFFIVGSGGAADVLATANDVILTIPLAPLRYVEKLSYITGPGQKVTTVVSDQGVFEKNPGEDELVLKSILRHGQDSIEARVNAIKSQVGWPLQVDPNLTWVPDPSEEELKALRSLDPRRAFLEPI